MDDSHRLRIAHRLTPWIVALAVVAGGAGLQRRRSSYKLRAHGASACSTWRR
jgi:MYXO-CTERM domain-containing protein